MTVWVLNKLDNVVFLLDSGYFVWDFDFDSLAVLHNFIDIKGYVSRGVVVPAVREYDKETMMSWPYVMFGDEARFIGSGYLETWERKGYLVAEKLEIYNPNWIMADRMYGLLSEKGDILRMEPSKGVCIDVEKLHRRLVGGIAGMDYSLVLTENVDVAATCNMYQSRGSVNVYMDYHRNSEKSTEITRQLYNNAALGLLLQISRWS